MTFVCRCNTLGRPTLYTDRNVNDELCITVPYWLITHSQTYVKTRSSCDLMAPVRHAKIAEGGRKWEMYFQPFDDQNLPAFGGILGTLRSLIFSLFVYGAFRIEDVRAYVAVSYPHINHKPPENRQFWASPFREREPPNFRPPFSNQTHFRPGGKVWLSSVRWPPTTVAFAKEEKKEDG